MNLIRSRLLIALVLFGVLGAGMFEARAETATTDDPSAGAPASVLRPGAAPDAGEPDVPQGSPPPRVTGASRDRAGEPVLGPSALSFRSLAETLRWTWVIWMARYLNRVD